MTPSNPILKVGEPFRFSCVLNKTNTKLKKYDSSDIYFNMAGRIITSPHTDPQIVNGTIADLVIQNDTTADLVIQRLVGDVHSIYYLMQ